jgi:hypothetical protein
MLEKNRRQQLSCLRVELRGLLEELEQALEPGFARTPLVKGNVYERAYRCGAARCVCRRGRLHRNVGLSWSQDGRARFRQVPPERVAELRRKSEDYLRLRRARAAVTVLGKKIVGVLDQIQEVRREEPFDE